MLESRATKVRLIPAWGYLPAATDQGLIRLVQAIIVNAVLDARRKGKDAEEARQWLQSEDCAYYCSFTGVNFRMLHDWAVSESLKHDAEKARKRPTSAKRPSPKVTKRKSKSIQG